MGRSAPKATIFIHSTAQPAGLQNLQASLICCRSKSVCAWARVVSFGWFSRINPSSFDAGSCEAASRSWWSNEATVQQKWSKWSKWSTNISITVSHATQQVYIITIQCCSFLMFLVSTSSAKTTACTQRLKRPPKRPPN